jgi:hypothetical protein
MSKEQYDIKYSINGDRVIGFTSVKQMKAKGWMDAPKVSTYLMGSEDPVGTHLGLIDTFAGASQERMPFLRDLLANKAVLEIENDRLTYDMPVVREDELCYTAEDTSNLYDEPGVGGNIFEIVLNQEYSKGDLLSPDVFKKGLQVMISNDIDVIQEGENFRHFVTLGDMERDTVYPKDYLKAGVQWFKTGHVVGEFETDFSAINGSFAPAGTITNEWMLGDPMGVETFYTRKAAGKKAAGLSALTDEAMNKVMKNVESFGEKEVFFTAPMLNGKLDSVNLNVGTTLEYLALLELHKLEAHQLLFAEAAVFRTGNGTKHVTEGAWHQLMRGKTIEYSRPGGITINHLKAASNYIFGGSGVRVEDRKIMFKAGYNALENVRNLFNEIGIRTANAIPGIIPGQDKQVTGVLFEGPLDNLKLNRVNIGEAYVPGVGVVSVEHDPSLDFRPFADRRSTGFNGEGYADTSWSLIIWDVTAPEYSNIEDRIRGGKVVTGGNKKANIYYVTPKGGSLTYGYEQGRMANGSQNFDIQTSLKTMGRQFWGIKQSGVLIPDLSRFLVIQLDKK